MTARDSSVDFGPTEKADLRLVPVEEKFKEVLTRVLPMVPAQTKACLVAMTEPAALATIAAVTGVWAGSHFIGIGELADVILMMVGYAALGGVAISAGESLSNAVSKTITAHTEADYNAAAALLARAISLVGVNVVLFLLTKRKPDGTFKREFMGRRNGPPMPSLKVVMKSQFPRNGRYFYKPKLVFTSKRPPGEGATKSWTGDMIISRLGSNEERLLAIYHERVHSFLVPKIYLLRSLRCYIAQGGYVRSYLLRYIEEAMAESIARARVHGLSRSNLVAGLQFPLQGNLYQITIAALGEEMRGIVYGPITVGGMVYNVYSGAMFDDE